MRRLLSRWGAIALLLCLLSCTGRHPTPPITRSPTPPAVETATPTIAAPQLAAPTQVPQVDPERLLTHLQTLQGDRFTAPGRDRARAYLVKTLKDAGWDVTTPTVPGGANVVARQPQVSPNTPTVLVVAHFDTVAGSPGADDNGTGVVAALEVARLLRTRSAPQALAIALFDQEEVGLVGSQAFTRIPANIENLLGVINLEMLGYTCNTPGCQTYPEGLPVTPPSDRGDFLGIIGDREHDYLLKAFQLAHQTTLPPIITIPIPFKGLLTPDVLRSDHAPFWLKNIGAVMISDTANFRNPHYHQPSDAIDTLNLDFFTQATQLVVNATTVLLDSKPATAKTAS